MQPIYEELLPIIERLEKRAAELEERLDLNSTNYQVIAKVLTVIFSSNPI